jgi:hypothetical protein
MWGMQTKNQHRIIKNSTSKGILDKEQTSYDDLLDALRLSQKAYQIE